MVALISHTPTNNWTINLTTDILKWVSMKHNRLRTNFDFFTIGDFILYHNELLVSCYFSCWKDEGIITHAPFLLLCNFPFQTTPEEENQPCLSFYSYSMQVSQIHIFYVSSERRGWNYTCIWIIEWFLMKLSYFQIYQYGCS